MPRVLGELHKRNSAKFLCNFGKKRVSTETTNKRELRLLNKSTGLCKLVKGSIKTDTCPVLKKEVKKFLLFI